MRKQIIYADFTRRLLASTVDITLFSLMLMPISTWLGNKVRYWYLNDFLIEKNINTSNINAVTDFYIQNMSQLTSSELDLFLHYTIMNILYAFMMMGICYLTCWFKWQNTPGKALLHLKIVDDLTLMAPTRQQFLKRYVGYGFSILNIFTMPFSKRNRGIQDIISNTVVIKL